MKKSIVWIILITFACSSGAREFIAVEDNFSDGDINANPSWEAGDMHWYNPFFVEKINGRSWAGSKRYGSMGTFFSHPEDRLMPISLDSKNHPIKISFEVLFRTSTTKDAIKFSLRGSSSILSFCYYPHGKFLVTCKGGIGNKKTKTFQHSGQVPKCVPGKPLRLQLIIGDAKRISLCIDNKPVYSLSSALFPKADPLVFQQFDRIAFMGANNVQERNIHLLVPDQQDTKAYRWITDIKVRGSQAKIQVEKIKQFNPPKKSILLFTGFAGVGTHPKKNLEKYGYTVTEVFDSEPLRGEMLNNFRLYLTTEKLADFETVVLFDINALKLGESGCAALIEYVRVGGRLCIIGGTNILNRGRYFSSLLSELLPVDGVSGWEQLEKSDQDAFTYQYKLSPKSTAKKINKVLPVYEHHFGKGIVRVAGCTLLGRTGKQRFWKKDGWLDNIISK